MTRGNVYTWTPDPKHELGGSAALTAVTLLRLEGVGERLCGRHVVVRNAGEINFPHGPHGGAVCEPLGDAEPDADGNFLFQPGRGGGRIDKVLLADPDFRWRYIQAARFGEVNAYYHVDRAAAYVDSLMRELGALGRHTLPKVTVVVNAHDAASDLKNPGLRDGVRGPNRWLPFQGGHYRLSGEPVSLPEHHEPSPAGEIHLGPGFELVYFGALVEAAGGRYRANASHNPGILYHEYAHHLTRHTADLRGNELRQSDCQDNRKTALDEGTADYFAATLLDTPHIWAFHQRHDRVYRHPRSLLSSKTMAHYERGPGANAHANGTIWACALWDLRQRLAATRADGVRVVDRLLVAALLLLGRRTGKRKPPTPGSLRRARNDFGVGLAALLEGDRALYGGDHGPTIREVFANRGISAAEVASSGGAECQPVSI